MTMRVVVADDSSIARRLLRRALSETGVSIAAECDDGPSTLRAVAEHRPNLLLLDIEMPGTDGLSTLRLVRREWPETAVVMCSALTRRGAAVTLEALSLGAADYITKPESTGADEAVRAFVRQLKPRLEALSQMRSAPPHRVPRQQVAPFPLPVSQITVASGRPQLLVIGSSTGGPSALEALFRALPGRFSVPVLVVQHMPELFSGALAARLADSGQMPVIEARDGTRLQPGLAVVARGGHNVEVCRAGEGFAVRELSAAAQESCSPSVDLALTTAARVAGGGVVACVLTGMGQDGLAGCRRVSEAGGRVIAQSEASSAVWGMSRAVIESGMAQHTGSPIELAQFLSRLNMPERKGFPPANDSTYRGAYSEL